jgi:hypothetical protein
VTHSLAFLRRRLIEADEVVTLAMQIDQSKSCLTFDPPRVNALPFINRLSKQIRKKRRNSHHQALDLLQPPSPSIMDPVDGLT